MTETLRLLTLVWMSMPPQCSFSAALMALLANMAIMLRKNCPISDSIPLVRIALSDHPHLVKPQDGQTKQPS
jgi:hypothetical protein